VTTKEQQPDQFLNRHAHAGAALRRRDELNVSLRGVVA
jgi:hypothetical protein